MDEFLRNGQSLLEAAHNRDETGTLAILIGRDGSFRAIEHSDWPLESLAAEHGARMAYRVSKRGGNVRVEGRSGTRTLVLEQTLSDPHRKLQLW